MGTNPTNPSTNAPPQIAAQQQEQQQNWENEQRLLNGSMNTFNGVNSALNNNNQQQDPRLAILQKGLPNYRGNLGVGG